MRKVFFIIIFLLTCRSAQITDVSPPEDYKPAIERAEKFLESGGSGDYKDSFLETVQALKSCNQKQRELYSATQNREEIISGKDKEIKSLKKEFSESAEKIIKLTDEKKQISEKLAVWERREFYFWAVITLIIVGSLIYTFRTPILFLIKKSVGIPL